MRLDASSRTLITLFAFLIAPAPASSPGDLYRGRDYILPPAPAAGPQAAAAALPAAPDGAVVAYHSFHDGAAYSMLRFNGLHTALLLQRKDLDRMGLARVRKLLDEQDLLYAAMAELTGGEPSGSDLLPIAVVETTCGGGCGFIGSKGVEIIAPVFHAEDYLGYVTHEMLHNFDRFSSHLFNGVDVAHAWNAFFDHFVPYFIHHGERSLHAEDVLGMKVTDKLGPFENHEGAEWQNCVLNVQCDPKGGVDPVGMSLLTQGGVLLRIAQLHGRHPLRNWIPTLQGLIASRGLDPATMTPQQKSDLMIESVGRALGVDVSCYFDGWHWPVGAAVRSALSAFGANARCQDPDGDGRSAWARDCRADDPAAFPGAVETVDGVDTDCDGATDDLLLAESGDFPGDAASAQAVALAQRITGRIGPSPDPDFFRFTLAAPASVRFTVKSRPDFSGFFTFHGPEGLRFAYVDTLRTEIIKYALAAGTWTFDMNASQPGSYEIVVAADYGYPMAEDYQPVTFTPAPATVIGANQYRLPTPATPAPLAGLPALTLEWWSSRLGAIGSLPPASAPHFDWSAPAGTDPERLVLRARYRSSGVPAHPASQHLSLLGPTPWTSQDIGAVGVAGSSSHFGEEDFVLRGSGADIWNAADAFRFTWVRLNGNGEVKARVLQVQNTHEFAKAGVMFRDSLTPTSKNVLAALIPGNQFTFQRRTAPGGTSVSTKVAGLATPHWVRITRSGDVFRAFRSADGAAWTEVGAVTMAMQANAYAGLALTSHNNAVLGSASFDNVILSGGAVAISGRIATSAGAGISGVNVAVTGSQAGSASTDANGNYTVSGLPANGNYTVTPSKAATSFSPTSRSFTNLQANAVADFTGTPTGGGLPSPWQTQDIGNVVLSGSAAHNAGTFTVTGAGADIWNAADAFRFVHLTLAGDADVRARVGSVQNTHAWAKAGVMIRENLTPGSRNAAMIVSAASGLSFQSRAAAGGISTSIKTPGAAPKWVRITRAGSLLTGYWSDNGASWTPVGSVTIAMSSTVHLGLAVTSHTTAALCQAVFTGVSAGALWTRSDVGAVGLAGSAAVTGTAGTVSASGADIWGTADAFTYLHRRMSGDGSVTARVSGVQNTHAWAKAGVMIRDGLGAGAAHASLFVTPASGVAFQRRTAANAASASTAVAGAAPRWVRVTRAGNVFTAFHSADGAAWTQVGTATFAMGADVRVGLAVTSHNNAVLCQGTFDNIAVVE